MKIKLDENIPASLAAALVEFGHDVDTVLDENLKGADDRRVWQAAQSEQRFFITQDLDFSNIDIFQPGSHSGLLLVRIGSPNLRILSEKITGIFGSENTEDWGGCFIVLTNRKLRIRRPQ